MLSEIGGTEMTRDRLGIWVREFGGASQVWLTERMAIEDIALATSLSNVTVVAPADEPSMRAATRAIFEVEGLVYLRSGRPKMPIVYPDGVDFELGKANQLREGDDVTIMAYGLMVAAALEAAAELSKDSIEARVLDMHAVKPLDADAVEQAARETGAIVTAEEHVLNGGMGAEVARTVGQQYPVPMAFVGIDNAYAESGDPEELLRKYGLMPTDIKRAVNRTLTRK